MAWPAFTVAIGALGGKKGGGPSIFLPAGSSGGEGNAQEIECNLVSLKISSPLICLNQPGNQTSLIATASFSNCSDRNVTDTVEWTSTRSSIATVSSGIVTGVGVGSANITASYESISSLPVSVDVMNASLTTVTVIRPSSIFLPAQSYSFRAEGTYTGGCPGSSTSDISNQVLWSLQTNPNNIGIIDPLSGRLDITTVGDFTVKAELNSIQGDTTFRVERVLTSISFDPRSVSIPNGINRENVSLMGIYSDGQNHTIQESLNNNSSVTWGNTNEAISTYNPNTGIITSNGIGANSISATLVVNGTTFSSSLPVTVTNAVVVGLRMFPEIFSSNLLVGNNRSIQFYATYSDGSEQEITNSGQLTTGIEDPEIARIEPVVGGGLQVYGVGPGTTNIRASFQTFSIRPTIINVESCTLSTIVVTPNQHNFSATGQTRQFTATGNYISSTGGSTASCPSTVNLTNSAVWTSQNNNIFTVNDEGGNKGLATAGNTVGSAEIRASLSGITGFSTINRINNVNLVSISISPANHTLEEGQTQAYTATGLYSDSSTANLSSLVTWSVIDDSGTAFVSNSTGTRGLVTAGNQGQVSIIAIDPETNIQGSTQLTIIPETTSPTLVQIVQTGSNFIRVKFSEDVRTASNGSDSANNISNWKVATGIGIQGSCSGGSIFSSSSQTGDFSISSITVVEPSVYTIHFSGVTQEKIYRLIASPAIRDLSGNTTGCPNNLSFQGSDNTAPYLLSATSIAKNSVLVTYSEPVSIGGGGSSDALNPANYLVVEDPSDGVCTNPPNVNSVQQFSATEFLILWDVWEQCDIRYSLTVSSMIHDTSANQNLMGSPRILTWYGNEAVRILSAESTSLNTIRIVFSKPVHIDTSCNSIATCQQRFWLPPSLGVITSAVIGTGNLNYIVTLTHSLAQTGASYTVIGANGLDGDGYNNLGNIFQSIRSANGLTNLMSQPRDRASFRGSGDLITNFAGGAFISDPFQDDTAFSFSFNYDNRIYLGTNNINTSSFRFDPSGGNSILTTFRFPDISKKGFGCTYNLTFNPACIGDLTTGPDGEYGVAGFNSLRFNFGGGNIREGLFVGTLKAGVNRVYFTEQKDAELTWSHSIFSATGGGNTKSIQTIGSHNSTVYIGLSSAHGTQSPVAAFHSASSPGGGALTISSGSDMSLRSMNLIGKNASGGGSVKNPCTFSNCVVGVDLFYSLPASTISSTNAGLFIANNGGVMYSSATSPTAVNDFSIVLNLTKAARGNTSLALPTEANGGLEKVSPGFRAVPFLVVYKGHMYMARNLALDEDNITNITTRNGAELWRCATACNLSNNWTLVFNIQTMDKTSNNKAISLLRVNGNALYLGIDNNSDGIGIFRAELPGANDPITSKNDFIQQGSWGLGVNGNIVKKILSSTSIAFGGSHYIYVIAGDDFAPVALRAFRQID